MDIQSELMISSGHVQLYKDELIAESLPLCMNAGFMAMQVVLALSAWPKLEYVYMTNKDACCQKLSKPSPMLECRFSCSTAKADKADWDWLHRSACIVLM